MTARVTVCVDWGSTNLRAWHFADGRAGEARQFPGCGIRSLQPGGFEEALVTRLGDWLTRAQEVVLSGMITSRTGWVETPYLECPAAIGDLRARAVRATVGGVEALFLPGICQTRPSSDVMRGEELQILGAMAGRGSETILLPGTHSKWAALSEGVVRSFGTWMTGELYDLVLNHSLAGRLAEAGPDDASAFDAGLDAAERDQPLAALFAARAGVLLGAMPAPAVRDYLSGLLIGTEVREARARGFCNGPLTLVAEADLRRRYRLALARFSAAPVREVVDATERGFARLLSQSADVA